MKTMKTDIQKIANNKVKADWKGLNKENGIIVPALLWWMGVPAILLIMLWVIGIL